MQKVKITVRESFIDPKGNVTFAYPENYTQQQRGFTPSGSAKLNFDAMRRMDIKADRRNVDSVNRKPTKGSMRISQVIKSIQKMVIPARYNVYGELSRPEMYWNKIKSKVIHHVRPLRNQRPLFPTAN